MISVSVEVPQLHSRDDGSNLEAFHVSVSWWVANNPATLGYDLAVS